MPCFLRKNCHGTKLGEASEVEPFGLVEPCWALTRPRCGPRQERVGSTSIAKNPRCVGVKKKGLPVGADKP